MEYYLGVDIGSAFAKAVVLKESSRVSHAIIPSGADYQIAADRVIEETLDKAGIGPGDVRETFATGYGRSSVRNPDRVLTDVSCIARGISHLFPSARTVIDIGGQYSRIIRLDAKGRNVSFLTSEKCAGGSGGFLEIIAHVLELDFDELGPLSMKSGNRVNFNTGCAVFAETEAISRVTEGAKTEDILAGVHHSLAAKIQSLVERLGSENDIALSGGGAKDSGLIYSIEETLDTKLLVADEPQIVAALGAALLAGNISSP